ncbi:GAF domain-containing protein [Salinigranum sp.]|uniref:GAF domain-containing protein n=1 Tax=Salinigranum sp. TaxID=1966351 RepID=UPI003562EBA1
MVTDGLTDALRETLDGFDPVGVPRTTPEVADSLDIGRRAAYARLERLVEADRLETKKVGANARVWWRPPTAPVGHDEPRATSGRARDRPEAREATALASLERASVAGDVGLWSWAFETDVVTVNTCLAAAHGIAPDRAAAGIPADALFSSVHEEDRERVRAAFERAIEGAGADEFETEYRLQSAATDWQWVLARGEVAYDEGGTPVGMAGALFDVTTHHRRERELADRAHQQAVVVELGQRALGRQDVDALLTAVSERVAETLDADYAKVLEYRADDFLLRAGTGWADGRVGDATVGATREYQAGYTLRAAEPVVVDDYERENRFVRSDLLSAHDIASGISVAIGPPDRPWGVLSVHATTRRQFSTNDISFVQSVANVLFPALERRRREQALERHREHLTALNGLNEVVHDIAHAVIEQSTREEIEATVCERLAETDSYLFAWTGEVDVATQTVTLRTEAGVEGYLDGVTISVDPDDDRSEGPTGRALRTREIQVTNDIERDARHDPWRDHVESYDFRSSAAIPILHEGTVYGVLNVYAERPNAFRGQERAVIAQLGEIVGHAIVATERKRALISDEVVELEFVIEDVLASIGVDSELDDPIVLERVVPVKDGDYLFYGRTTLAGVDTVREMVRTVPFYEAVRFRQNGDDRPFELQVSDPPVLSTISALEGSVEQAVIEHGDYRLTVHVPPRSDVGAVMQAMTDAYPEARLLRRRQLTRRSDGTSFTASSLTAALTDRQRSALEAAYHAGFFEWPRESDGQDVARSLGVSPPTFHQHLRKGEKRIFDSLLTARGTTSTGGGDGDGASGG